MAIVGIGLRFSDLPNCDDLASGDYLAVLDTSADQTEKLLIDDVKTFANQQSTIAVTLPSSSWIPSGNLYVLTMNVTGIKATSTPRVEINYPSNITLASKKLIDKSASGLVSLTTNNGSITVRSVKLPTVNIPIMLIAGGLI